MKNKYFIMLVTSLCVGVNTVNADASVKKQIKQSEQDGAITVNAIATTVYGPSSSFFITDLDYKRKTLDGQQRTRKELVSERLMYDKCTNFFHMPPAWSRVDRHIESLKYMHGLSDVQIEDLFKQSGYSLQDGKIELARSYTISDFSQQYISNKLIVTESDIVAYYKKHPEVVPDSYYIKKGFIAKKQATEEQMKEMEQNGEYQDLVNWDVSYWIARDELSDQKKFITDMKPGQIKVIAQKEEYEVIQLVKRKHKHTRTLEERRAAITHELSSKNYQQLYDEFQKALFKEYTVVDLKL